MTILPAPGDFFASEKGVCVYVMLGTEGVRVCFDSPESLGVVEGEHPHAERALARARAAFAEQRPMALDLFAQIARARSQ